MAEFDPRRRSITGRQSYFLEVPGTESSAQLSVVSFEATERLGEPNVVCIELTHPQQLSRADYLNREGTFRIVAEDRTTKQFSGFIERFSTTQTTKDYVKYEVVLKSHLARLQAVTNTQVFQHLTIPQIIQKILLGHGMRDHQMSFRLRGNYPKLLWRFQYQMTDFDYVHMLMEKAGIYCYIVETQHGDQIVLGDDIDHYIYDPRLIATYREAAGLEAGGVEAVTTLKTHTEIVPQSYAVADYNPDSSWERFRDEANVASGDPTTYGQPYIYGTNHLDQAGAKWQAQLRHEAALARQVIYEGTSNVLALQCARVLETDIVLPDAPQGQVLIEITHCGARDRSYSNSFRAIPADRRFRLQLEPARWTKIAGSLSARICSPDKYAYGYLNSAGYYVVRLDADFGTWPKGGESVPLRLAKPFAGKLQTGMHFVALDNDEAKITFRDGDPDKPEISGFHHHSQARDLVTSDRRWLSRNMIRTQSNNKLRMEDWAGQEGIKLSTEHSGKLHASSLSEDMMPGNHGLFGLAGAAADGRTRAQREFDILWYKRANLNNVTRISAGQAMNVAGVAKSVATAALNALPGGPKPLKNIEFATRDFELWERTEIAWRTWMGGPKDNPRLQDRNTAAMTAEPSHHQKMVLVDYEAPEKAIGFVMGHNTLDEYWDRDDHTYLRQAPRMGRNGLHPRQDMSAIVTGPILEYLNRNFCQAWDDATGQNITAARSGLHCRLKLRHDLDTKKFGRPVMAQILRTQSQHGKGGTKDISKLYLQAVNNTTNFVYIENQYFRYMPVADKLRENINAQIRKGRNLAKHGPVYLFVVTNSNDDGIGLGTVSTYQMLDALGYGDRMPGVEKLEKDDQLGEQAQPLMDQLASEQATSQRMMTQGADFSHMQGLANYATDSQLRQNDIQQQLNEIWQEERRVAGLSPDGTTKDGQLVPPQDMPGLKVLVCTLVAPDTPAGQPWDYVYIHQKLMIIDDVFMTHGSANVNRRSMEVDSELNICHEHGDVTRALRKQMWKLHTNGGGAQDDMSDAYTEWSKLISRNTKFQHQKQAPVASLVGFLRTSPSRSYLD